MESVAMSGWSSAPSAQFCWRPLQMLLVVAQPAGVSTRLSGLNVTRLCVHCATDAWIEGFACLAFMSSKPLLATVLTAAASFQMFIDCKLSLLA